MITAISANDISVCSVIKGGIGAPQSIFNRNVSSLVYIRVSNNTNYQRRNLNVSANRYSRTRDIF